MRQFFISVWTAVTGIKKEQFLPLVLIVIDIGSAAPYAIAGDWKMALYWLFAAGLNFTVTF